MALSCTGHRGGVFFVDVKVSQTCAADIYTKITTATGHDVYYLSV